MNETEEDSLQELRLKYPPIIVEDTRIPTLNYDENEPRLIISEIINENFKSYGGIRKLGPFHQNFTCIIGPNGSGKSNVIDALLFVFGFRATKIRSKNLSVLIHKSELFPNVQSCTVKVYFQRIIPTSDRDSDFTVIENSQFYVSRTAFKDNSNVYKINDKKANPKEVVDFLRKQGIDLDHNRFLILQGEVEQISLMKPKAATEHDDGLLEYLEDIIGSNRFKNPINILFKRLDELCDLRMEKLNRVKVVEKEKKDLEGVRNDALRYLRLCNEITIRKNITYQIKCRELKAIEASATEQVEECKNELKGILVDIERVNALKMSKEKVVKEIVQKHLIKMQEFEKSKKQFKELEIQDTTLRDSRKHCKSKVEETRKLIKSKQNELAKYENVPEESVPRSEQLTKEIKDLEAMKHKEVLNEEKAQNDLKEETKDLQEKCDEKNLIFMKEEKLLTTQELKIKSIQCERDLLMSNLTKEEGKLANIESAIVSISETVKAHKETIRQLSADIPRMEKEYNDSLKTLNLYKNDFKRKEAEIQDLRRKLDSGTSHERGGETIKFLVDQQNMGHLKNILGRLGDLAYVDPKYDVALSTACGRFDNIITENIDDAQRSVELMKRHRIEKSAFIAMDKVAHWGSRCAVIKTPYDIPRAFDLLKMVDDRFRAVFYFALRDLLVALDIQMARKANSFSQTKFRIVTMTGELVEISGAMSGGGSRIIKGKIRTNSDTAAAASRRDSISAIDRRDLEKKLADKRQSFDELTRAIGDLSRKVDDLQRDIETAKTKKKDSEDRVQASQDKERALHEENDIAKNKVKELRTESAQVTTLDKTIKKLSSVYDKDASVVDQMKREIKKLNEEITNIGAAKLGCIKSRLDSINDKIKEKSGVLKKIQMSVKNAEKICARTTLDLEDLDKQKKKLDSNIVEIDEKMKELEELGKNSVAEYHQMNLEIEKLAHVKEEEEKELSAVSEEYKTLEVSRKQSQRLVDERREKLAQFAHSVAQMQSNIDKLKLFSIPEECELDGEDSFMDIIGKGSEDMVLYSSQPNSHNGQTLRTYSDSELTSLQLQKIGFQDLEDKMTKQKPNLMAIEEYRLKEEMYMQRAAELTAVTEMRDCQRRQMEQLKRQRLDEFLAGFNLITGKLKEMYQLITLGGDAELELVDTLDPFSEGIVFSVRPPKKSWKNISNLSGGEKTLSSLALVFALHHFKPTPFYVMDEIDAALDFKNVSIVANYIKERTRNAQFIIISLRNNMYELSDRLVGICKPFNFSKTCVLNPKSLEGCLSAHTNLLHKHLSQMLSATATNTQASQPAAVIAAVDADGDGDGEDDDDHPMSG